MNVYVRDRGDDYILNVNEDKFIEHLIDQFRVDAPELNFDGITASQSEVMIRAEDMPGTIATRPGEVYPRPVFTFRIPVTGGDPEWLKLQPDQFTHWHASVYVDAGDLCFDQVLFTGDAAAIKRDKDDVVRNMAWYNEAFTSQVDHFNIELARLAEAAFRGRKSELLRRSNLLEAIGVPLKRREGVSETFSVPGPISLRRITPAPVVTQKGYKPEPTLEDDDYEEILRIIHNAGKAMEQAPSTYRGKGEEDIRDLFFFNLSPRYPGSTTAEAFNKAGKTDILMQHEGGVLFVGECKIWRGAASFRDSESSLGPISQLLSYLTWRNSKSALLLFVENQDISRVIAQVKELVPQHPNFLRLAGEPREAWFDYRLHLTGDENRELKMAVMVFHLPELKAS